MFTGIVQSTVQIKAVRKTDGFVRLTIQTPRSWKLKAGDSVAVDGVCLTVEKKARGTWTAMLMSETLSKTSFGVRIPPRVNLERPMRLGGSLDGHLVQGHVDTVGRVLANASHQNNHLLKIAYPKKFSRLLVPKGSVAIDGVSLTVVAVTRTWFTTALVDYTLAHTTLGEKKPGDGVNLEFDILAKYITRYGAKR